MASTCPAASICTSAPRATLTYSMSLRVSPPLISSGSSRPFTLLWNQEIFLPLVWLVRHHGDHGNAACTRPDEAVRIGDPELLAAGSDEYLILLAGGGWADFE